MGGGGGGGGGGGWGVIQQFIIPRPNGAGVGGGGGGGILDSPCPSVRASVRPSVRPSVCRRHGFRSVSQVCFGISIWNFIWMLMVVIGRSLFGFSATSLPKWPPGGHIGFFGFRTLTLVWLWISTPNFSGTILIYMGRSLLIFSDVIFKMAAWRSYWIFWFLDSVSRAKVKFALEFQFQISYACWWWS